MKNILFLNIEFPPVGGGASGVSFDIAKYMSEHDFNIDVVTMHVSGLDKYQEINKNLTVYRIFSGRRKKYVSYVYEHLIFLVHALFFIRKLVRNKKYDICYCHFIVPTGVIALILKKIYKLDYVLHSHGSDVLSYNNRFKFLYKIISPFWKMVVKESRKVIVPSNFLKEKIEKILPKIKNIEIIPNPITKNHKENINKKENLIVCVGRILENKGCKEVIDAFKRAELNDWSLVFIGDGSYRKKIETLIDVYDLDKSVNITGWLEKKELYTYLSRAKIYISASRFESFNVSLIEALSYNCIPVVSDIVAHKEIVTEEFIFKDMESFVEKIKSFSTNHSVVIPDISKFYIDNVGAKVVDVFK